jgi:DNA-binding transcriptional regulator YiaG
MTAKQFERKRKLLWKSQAQAAEAIGVDQSAISNWETGRRPVPGIVVKFLECIEEREHLEMLVGKYAPTNMGNTIPFP